MRLIDADEMIKRLQEWNTNDAMDKALYNFTMHRILEQPTIEPKRKTGEWRVLKDRSSGQEFSCCNRCDHYYSANTSDWNFCPNCGADMRKKTNESD